MAVLFLLGWMVLLAVPLMLLAFAMWSERND